jgi:prepilin-type N-terminal cleavage/methylation domain-containing protein/prepilin-type processing-associated H-X9-DG protein
MNLSKSLHPLHRKNAKYSRAGRKLLPLPGGEGWPPARCCQQPGFTLTELLVAIATLLIVATTIGTALATTKPNTLAFQCLNNLRQLGLAWRMYSDDNQGKLVYNQHFVASASWAFGELTYDASSVNTNTELLINHAKYPSSAFLGPYLKTASVFKCPADKSVVTIGAEQFPRVRSMSLNVFMGSQDSYTSPAYTLYTNINQLTSPAQRFTFLDEHADSINDGAFLSSPSTRYLMPDLPASYHDGAGNFIFADGHGESHRWTDRRTTRPIFGLPNNNIFTPGNIDVDWVQQHASELR